MCPDQRVEINVGHFRKISSYQEKDVFRLVTSKGQRKILSSQEESNLRYSTTGPLTSFLHTSRISNVDSPMFVNGVRKMLTFELVKEMEKDVSSCHQDKGNI